MKTSSIVASYSPFDTSLTSDLWTEFCQTDDSITLGHPIEDKNKLLDELCDMWNECKYDDWDGDGAIGIEKATFEAACELVNIFPNYISFPVITPDQYGGILFEWTKDGYTVLMMSISSTKVLSFAARESDDRYLTSDLHFPNKIIFPLNLIKYIS